MSLLTRLTHQTAKLLLNPQRYVTALPRVTGGRRPAVYLTFDDGPHPDRTNRILDQFAEVGGYGTFFAIGRRARRNPQTLRRILREVMRSVAIHGGIGALANFPARSIWMMCDAVAMRSRS